VARRLDEFELEDVISVADGKQWIRCFDGKPIGCTGWSSVGSTCGTSIREGVRVGLNSFLE
jgi:hypothetical protein